VHDWPPLVIVAFAWSIVPLLAFGFAEKRIPRVIERLPVVVGLILPALFGVPYLLVALSASNLRTNWLIVYFLLPVLVAVVLRHARQADPQQQGDWRDFAILLVLGLTVDLRWLEPAWPAHLAVISKLILLDAGLYGFLAIRQLSDVGYDLRFRSDDLKVGLRELAFYAPLALLGGFLLGFLHFHKILPTLVSAGSAWIFTFILIALPEEIFFRGWMQNLLERRLGRRASLWLTAAIFGLSHFNKRAVHFNWRYVLLAILAGVFYGRAWRQQNRVAASAITHASVDTIWSIWLL